MKHARPALTSHHTDFGESYSTHWWWLPALCWVSTIGAVAWLALSVEPADTAPNAGTTVSEPLPAVPPGA